VSSLKGEDMVKVEKGKREKKSLTCYNCGGQGHTSRQCPSEAYFCGNRKLVRQSFCCEGFVEGQVVNDIALDSGCSRTLERSDLVGEKGRGLRKPVTMQCAQGNSVKM